MQQRRLRLGDILDDYCPRERRVTNHVIVAMIEEDVKQTRCTTCDADHEYKHAKVPAQRRKKEGSAAMYGEVLSGLRKRPADEQPPGLEEAVEADLDETVVPAIELPDEGESEVEGEAEVEETVATGAEDEGPVHRPLIRATLPRPEGHVPERKLPDFTIRQPGGRGARGFGHGGGANRQGGRRPVRVHGQGADGSRFGGSRPGGDHPKSGRPPGHKPQRPGRPAGQGQGQSQGRGRKRGR